MKRALWKLGLGLVSTYSAYAMYVIFQTNSEIWKRNNIHDKEYKEKYSPIHILGKFQNPFIEYEHETLFHFIYNQIAKVFKRAIDDGKMKIFKPDFDTIWNNSQANISKKLTFTWFGQSCALVQIGPVNVLTDPIFNDYIINRALGPRRISRCPSKLSELPTPDIVLVSHDHPDHLEYDSVKQLKDSEKTLWVVPEGVGKSLEGLKVPKNHILEMSWWEKKDVSNRLNNRESGSKYEIMCLPAMHWSGRALYDSNHTLWCSFIILKDSKPILYHVGDTGYNQNMMQAIKTHLGRYGRIELVISPIGQYKPLLNKTRHLNPQEAVQMLKELHGKRMVGVHYGTFRLSQEKVLEPKQWLEKEVECNKLESKDVFAGELGKTKVFDI